MRRGLAVVILLSLPALSWGQLRVVSLNASNSGSATSGPRPGMDTILSAIGSTVSDDPTVPGNTGIIKAIDVLCLQEARSAATTGAAYAALLNQLYSTNRYQFGTLDGGSTGSGTQAIVFNSEAISLISSAAIGTYSTTTQPRQTLRYQLRPVGYGPVADVYIYNAHFKAGCASSDEVRRNLESQAIRADVNSLPSGANTIYLGDFNVPSPNDDMFLTLTATGNGQALDPINKANWNSSASFKNIHTQSPFNPTANPTNGFSGTSGGMDDRYDWQMTTANLKDGGGVAYIANSYQAFGNDGSHALDLSIDTGAGASPQVLFHLASILDHLPIVADYQLPARMSVAVGTVPVRVIVGASVSLPVTVTNSAPVVLSVGADELDYSVMGSGVLSGTGAGTALAATAGNSHPLEMDTTTPGARGGMISVQSSSEAVANGSFSQSVSTTVLAHANPSFDPISEQHTRIINFGIHARGGGSATLGFSIFNREHPSGYTAGLDLDQISEEGDLTSLSANVATFSNLEVGGQQSYLSALDTSGVGAFQTGYALTFSDEDLPGASGAGTMLLTLVGRVAIGGDANLDDTVNLSDFNILASNFGQSDRDWQSADFNRDGLVNLSDFNILASNFGFTAAASGPTPEDWQALASVVPEPGMGMLSLLPVICLKWRTPKRAITAR